MQEIDVEDVVRWACERLPTTRPSRRPVRGLLGSVTRRRKWRYARKGSGKADGGFFALSG